MNGKYKDVINRLRMKSNKGDKGLETYLKLEYRR